MNKYSVVTVHFERWDFIKYHLSCLKKMEELFDDIQFVFIDDSFDYQKTIDIIRNCKDKPKNILFCNLNRRTGSEREYYCEGEILNFVYNNNLFSNIILKVDCEILFDAKFGVNCLEEVLSDEYLVVNCGVYWMPEEALDIVEKYGMEYNDLIRELRRRIDEQHPSMGRLGIAYGSLSFSCCTKSNYQSSGGFKEKSWSGFDGLFHELMGSNMLTHKPHTIHLPHKRWHNEYVWVNDKKIDNPIYLEVK